MDLISNTEKLKDFISLAEAQSITGISKDYFRICIQKGYLQGHKIGRNWTTTKEWLTAYLQKYRPGFTPKTKQVSEKVSAEENPVLIDNIILPDPTIIAALVAPAKQSFQPVLAQQEVIEKIPQIIADKNFEVIEELQDLPQADLNLEKIKKELRFQLFQEIKTKTFKSFTQVSLTLAVLGIGFFIYKNPTALASYANNLKKTVVTAANSVQYFQQKSVLAFEKTSVAFASKITNATGQLQQRVKLYFHQCFL